MLKTGDHILIFTYKGEQLSARCKCEQWSRPSLTPRQREQARQEHRDHLDAEAAAEREKTA